VRLHRSGIERHSREVEALTPMPNPADLEALLAHTEWVRALAWSLVRPDGDHRDPDDVVQETWVAVLEHPPRPERNVRGWLATVVRNVVRQDRRAGKRRQERERAGARAEALEDATAVVERAELHRRVVNTVMKLEEPYRTALLLRFFEDLEPREMARRLDCSVETVRSQVRRGLAILRARLDAAWGERAAWVAALAPLLKMPAGAAVGTTSTVATGGALLTTGTKVALGGVALAAIAAVSALVPSLLNPDSRGIEPPPARTEMARTATERPDLPSPPPASTSARTAASGSGPSAETLPPVRPEAATSAAPRTAGAPKPRTPAERPPRPATPRPAASAPQTAFDPQEFTAEILHLARLFREHEDGMTRALAQNSPQASKNTRHIWSKIETYVAGVAREKSDPLKMPEFWTAVFSHPEYRPCTGKPGRFDRTWTFEWMGKKYPVEYHLQVSMDHKSREPAALVICLHPLATKFSAADHLERLWLARRSRPEAIMIAPEFPAGHAPEARWSDRQMLYATMGLLGCEVLPPKYAVDSNQWFLDGYLDGGADAWRLAGQFGDVFAGVIIRGAAPPEDVRFEDFRHTAFLLVGVPQTTLAPKDAKRLAIRMRRAGVQVAVANVTSHPLPGQEAETFRKVAPDVKRFLGKTRRDPYPDTLDWSVKENHTRRCYYVSSTAEVEAALLRDPAARKKPPGFRVSIDREGNKLVIVTHRILGLEIQLNDRILDLDRPVAIEVNGKVVFRGRAERSLRRLYDGFLCSGDPTRVFPWSHEISVPDAIR
jgi:RNA polymerase sigma factor (sigma-70 family)